MLALRNVSKKEALLCYFGAFGALTSFRYVYSNYLMGKGGVNPAWAAFRGFLCGLVCSIGLPVNEFYCKCIAPFSMPDGRLVYRNDFETTEYWEAMLHGKWLIVPGYNGRIDVGKNVEL
jgi:hypothetical protein